MTVVTRPALLLDVDGMLNVPSRGPDLDWVPADVLGPLDDRIYRLVVNPLHGEWLRSLSSLYDLVWCTTWWRVAGERIAPLLGLPRDLPAVPLSQPMEDVELPYSRKTPFVRRWANGRALAWVDDDIDGRDHAALTAADPAEDSGLAGTPPVSAALVLNADPGTGFTLAHVDHLVTWAQERA